MKETGVKWIGSIPNDWEIRKIKHCFYISKELANDKNPTVLSLARSGIKVRDISNNEGQLAASYDNYNIVKAGDLLLNPMDLYSGANCNVSEISGVISPAYVNLRKTIELNPKFFDYYFKCQYWTMAMFAHGKGVSFDNRWTISADSVLNYEIPFPKKEQQDAIVVTLNKKCENIDALIEVQNSQIEKLKEYKKSLITNIALGRNLTCEKKIIEDSWIGKLPSNWSAIQIKFVADSKIDNSFIDGDWIESGDISSEGIKYFTTGSVSDGIFKNQEGSFISEKTFMDLNCKYAYGGDLIISRLNEPYGRACIIPDYIDKCVLAVDIVILRPTTSFNKKYILYVTQCPGYQAAVGDKARGTAMKRISRTNLGNIKIPYPPTETQNQIVSYLDDKCSEIDNLIKIKEEKIDMLERLKRSLIYESVTGKKEVVS